jgi:hypothetical protein
MQMHKIGDLAPTGSVGNQTFASQRVPNDADELNLEFKIEAVGATPTVTYKFQGSNDDGSLADAASDWYDLEVLPNDAAAEVLSATKTAVGVYEYTLDLHKRATSKVRLVTSANTNVTYSSEARAVQMDA